ncbi:MAG: hypothetical protein Q9M28_07810 [Mariprofundaceae bacterium]|nr:hypothetical protein [Mariprofundaceae bacterium]
MSVVPMVLGVLRELIGDPQEYVGLEVATTIISLKTRFADSGAVNFKLHRWLPWNSAIEIGVENAVTWGTAKKANVKANTYITFTKAKALNPDDDYNPFTLTASIGVGNGRFEPINTNLAATTQTKIGAFGSLGLQVHPKVAIASSWTGKDLNMGLSLVPFTTIPVVLAIGRVDLLHKNQPASRWVVSFGYAIFQRRFIMIKLMFFGFLSVLFMANANAGSQPPAGSFSPTTASQSPAVTPNSNSKTSQEKDDSSKGTEQKSEPKSDSDPRDPLGDIM